MTDPEDFMRKQMKAFSAVQDALKAQQSIADRMLAEQQSMVDRAMKTVQGSQSALDKAMGPALRMQADLEKMFGSASQAMIARVQREIDEQERLQAFVSSTGMPDQIKAAIDALQIGNLLRSSPEFAPEPNVQNMEYLNAMHRAAEDSKAATREYIAAEIKRQLEARDEDNASKLD